MILVTAATGQVGGQAAKQLTAAAATVRALVRDPSRAEGLEGAELVRGSFEDERSAIGAVPDSPLALMREHYEVDEELRRGPWTWTLLRPRAPNAGRVPRRTCGAPRRLPGGCEAAS